MRKLLMTTLFLLALMLTGCKDDEEFTITPAPVPQEKEEIPEFSWEFDNNYKVSGRITKEALYGKWKLVEFDKEPVDYTKIIDFRRNDTVYITSLKDGKFEQIKEPFAYRFHREWRINNIFRGKTYYDNTEDYRFCENYNCNWSITAQEGSNEITFWYEYYILTLVPIPNGLKYRRLTDNSLSTLSLEDYKTPETKVGTPTTSDIKWEYDEDFENYEEDGQIRVIEGKWKLVNVGGIPVDYLEILDFDGYNFQILPQTIETKRDYSKDYYYGEWFDVQESGEPSEFPKIGNRVMIRNFGEFTVKKGNQKNEIILEDPNSQEQNYRTYRRLK